MPKAYLLERVLRNLNVAPTVLFRNRNGSYNHVSLVVVENTGFLS